MPKDEDIKKVMVIGSGPIVIGQAAEFDYSGSQACKALREEGVEVVLVNPNPATIQTDTDTADVVYIEPLTPEIVGKILKRERPDALLPTMGGQAGLNVTMQLKEMGVLDEVGVRVIGTPVESIAAAEDRRLFAELIKKIGEPIPRSEEISSVEEAIEAVDKVGGYPVLCRASYALGGTGSGVARNDEELRRLVTTGLDISLNKKVAIDECLLGWKEIEYEVMRDSADNCIAVCSMENVDPMGIHTGESIVVAPSQTLSDCECQKLKSVALKVIRALKLNGGCNIQFAVNPEKFEYYVIEVNPRVSRSSALASKASGYPIARVAAKLALGMTLDEIPNHVTKETPASFEPALDYIVVKIPRWPFDKFAEVDQVIGSQMKSTGEVMAIGRTFEEALQKAIRSLDIGRFGLLGDGKDRPLSDVGKVKRALSNPTNNRIFHIVDALKLGLSVEEISKLTGIDPWFIWKIERILKMEKKLRDTALNASDFEGVLREAKRMGFSDRQIAHLLETTEDKIREIRKKRGIKVTYKMVDTCAAEFDAKTPYYYSTYESEDEGPPSKRRKVVVIGGGPIRIGQGIEFDYCCVHAAMALREEGIEAIMINNNPETVSTDSDISDKLYFEPITFEDVMNVIEKEKPDGVIVQFGGQAPLNLAGRLARAGVKILGTPVDSIDRAEDRERFRQTLAKLGIAHPKCGSATSVEGAKGIAAEIGYPVLVRPSYVLGGRAMEIVQDESELEHYVREAVEVSPEHPVLIDKFLQDATELDVDALGDGENAFIGAIMEHIEQAGVHSGDSACVIPPQTVGSGVLETVKEYVVKLVRELKVVGFINLQLAVKDGTVYVLEVNPRASRTVPYVSKSIGLPLAKLATKLMLGKTLKELGLEGGVAKIEHACVKESVFPFAKLPGADPVLGPEMKSTGEVLGIDVDFGKGYFKAQVAAGNELPTEGAVFVSVSDSDKEAIVPIVRRFKKMGFKVYATRGTMKVLEENGIEVTRALKVSEGKPNVLDQLREGEINLIINTPTVGKRPARDGFKIRRLAVELGVPYITTVRGAIAAVNAIESIRRGAVTVRSINEYQAKIAKAG